MIQVIRVAKWFADLFVIILCIKYRYKINMRTFLKLPTPMNSWLMKLMESVDMKQTPNPSSKSTFRPGTRPSLVLNFQEHLQYKYYANSWSIYSPLISVLPNNYCNSQEEYSLFLLKEKFKSWGKSAKSTGLELLYVQNKMAAHPVNMLRMESPTNVIHVTSLGATKKRQKRDVHIKVTSWECRSGDILRNTD